MKFHNLRDFIAVARTGSLRAAARSLGLAQPSLSKSIQQLEKELGVPLFERSSRGAVLSTAGRAFLPRAEAAINELKRGQDEIRQIGSGSGGVVSMALSAAVVLTCLPEAMKAFQQRFPAASIRLVAGHFPVMFPELRAGALDFCIGPRPATSLGEEFSVEELFKNTRAVVCRNGHPLLQARRLEQLAGAQWIVTGAVGGQASEHDQIFLAHGLPVPAPAVQCEYITALLALLAGTDMLAVMPRQWAESDISGGKLTYIELDEQLPGADIVLIRKRGMPLAPASDHMLTLLLRQIEYYQTAGKTGQAPPLR